MIRVAFDIDDTLFKVVPLKNKKGEHSTFVQVPDYDLIQVLRWFHANGDTVFVWSAGGIDYAQSVVDRLGLTSMVHVIAKQAWGNPDNPENIDISFDDCEVKLAKVDVRVDRHKILK